MKKRLIPITLLFALHTSAQENPVVITPPPMETSDSKKEVRIVNSIIDFPDVEAQFKGGTSALQQFLSKEVNYPVQALEDKIEGKVYLYFVVKKNGKLKDVKVEKGAHSLLDQEAIRLVKAMPKWVPAEKDGKKVNTACRLPINFTL